jgi:predicted CopG family antitoxin
MVTKQIGVPEQVWAKLKELKQHKRETMGDTIERLMQKNNDRASDIGHHTSDNIQ